MGTYVTIISIHYSIGNENKYKRQIVEYKIQNDLPLVPSEVVSTQDGQTIELPYI